MEKLFLWIHLTFKQYPDQWSFLESVKKISESVLDNIIEMNDLSRELTDFSEHPTFEKRPTNSYSLPACAQKMLHNGVKQYQRISCFRLSVHLKRLGLPYDLAVAALKVWAHKNQPEDGKRTITESEIIEQTSYAFSKSYRGIRLQFSGCCTFLSPRMSNTKTCRLKNQLKNDHHLQ